MATRRRSTHTLCTGSLLPSPPSLPPPASVRDHDEADDRADCARRALVPARWEAQGGKSAATEPSILLLLEGRILTSIPRGKGYLDVYD